MIDFEEAKMHLGSDWVKTGTPEQAFAEAIYSQFELVNFLLGFICSKRLMVAGSVSLPSSILVLKSALTTNRQAIFDYKSPSQSGE